jgi:hypothetical protein
MYEEQRQHPNLLTDVDHYFTLREPCVASLRSDRHQIGMTDRHHRNAHSTARFPRSDSHRCPLPDRRFQMEPH